MPTTEGEGTREKVLVAGATGAIGRRLIPALLHRGYAVVAMTRRPDAVPTLQRAGADAVVANALEASEVSRAFAATTPDIVVHQLTALAGVKSFRNFDRAFAATNALRTRGTDNLLAGAQASGTRVVVAQSYGSWIYAPTGAGRKSENDPLDPDLPRRQRASLAAIRHVEEAVTSAPGLTGVALRYGFFYGPGTAIAPDGEIAEQVRRGMLPIIGDGAGVWSFLHVDDAVSATISAIERAKPGIYNIADDDPAPVAVWLPELARILGARPPRRVPKWVGRLAAGEAGARMFTRISGMSNEKARRELGWSPLYRTWRDGFRAALGA